MAMLTRYHEAVQEEAPINRTAGRVYLYLAEEVRKIAGMLISKLNDLVKKLRPMVPAEEQELPPCEALELVQKHRIRFESFDIVNGAVEKSKKWIAVSDDIKDIADPAEFVDAPHEQYRLPANAEAAGA